MYVCRRVCVCGGLCVCNYFYAVLEKNNKWGRYFVLSVFFLLPLDQVLGKIKYAFAISFN